MCCEINMLFISTFISSSCFDVVSCSKIFHATQEYRTRFFFLWAFYHSYPVFLAFCHIPASHCGIFTILVPLHHSCVLQCSVQHHIRTTCRFIYLFISLLESTRNVLCGILIRQRAAVLFIKKETLLRVNSLSVSFMSESTLLIDSALNADTYMKHLFIYVDIDI